MSERPDIEYAARVWEAHHAVAEEAAKIIGGSCAPDDKILCSWVNVITTAAVKAGWLPPGFAQRASDE